MVEVKNGAAGAVQRSHKVGQAGKKTPVMARVDGQRGEDPARHQWKLQIAKFCSIYYYIGM